MSEQSERIRELFGQGSGWVEIQTQLELDHYAVYQGLRGQIHSDLRDDIVNQYVEGRRSIDILRSLEIKEKLRCGRDTADFIVRQCLISLPRKRFIEINERRRQSHGNVYRLTGREFDQATVLRKHRRGLRVHELANLFEKPMTEVKRKLGL